MSLHPYVTRWSRLGLARVRELLRVAPKGIAVIWSYFDNRATSTASDFAVRALACAIYRDIGATIPT
jgi:hypothetical protein